MGALLARVRKVCVRARHVHMRVSARNVLETDLMYDCTSARKNVLETDLMQDCAACLQTRIVAIITPKVLFDDYVTALAQNLKCVGVNSLACV